jgi:hypothetical protein
MDEHLVKSARAQSMIQAFLANLKIDMKTLFQNLTAHEITLESLLYCRIVSISVDHEIWVAYIKYKEKENLKSNLNLIIAYCKLFLKKIKINVNREGEDSCNCYLAIQQVPRSNYQSKLYKPKNTHFEGALQLCNFFRTIFLKVIVRIPQGHFD